MTYRTAIPLIVTCVSLCGPSLTALAQPGYQPTAENLEAREWFQDAKFGLFVHWGAYSVLGAGEWIMQTRPISASAYERVASAFNPVAFDADEWVSLAKDAGMKYITITAKHHDGFAMYDSELTDWDIVDRTPYGKDVLAQLAEACRKEGIKLFFYYSQLDWHHTDYYPRGRTGHSTGRPDDGDWHRYIDFMNGQLSELLTNYGDLGGIWFDGMWDRLDAEWRVDETYQLIHELQPAALIGSNHHETPIPGEDYQMFEKDLPGANTAGFNTTEMSDLPYETAETINGSWGFNLTDTRYKSTTDLIQYLVKAAGSNANFLLNVGPMPTGQIQPEFQDTLRAVGRWLKENGQSVYGTRGGPVPPGLWGVTTQKDNTVFVHVLDWADPVLAIPSAGRSVEGARLLRNNERVPFREIDGAIVLTLPERPSEIVDEIVVLDIRR